MLTQNRCLTYGDRSPSMAISRGFIGERHDDETGLIYLNARYYDPVLARFVSPDDWDPTLPGVDLGRPCRRAMGLCAVAGIG